MSISIADRMSIHEVIALHGHLSDAGAFDRMAEVLADDIVYDMTEFGRGVVRGRIALCDMAIQLGDRNPLAHHVTNIVITAVEVDEVQAVSKGLAVNADGTTGSVTYEDTICRTAEGWRIARRRVIPRRKPLTP
ncbi:nuclear transport factor 2 family protein [Nocardia sp. NPDC060256]|uniref:nuclear transport factor 2 family protein n=1 Tax=unclassified Nocardia TaxID=2637762 RepID=UPI0036485D9F